MFYKVEVFEARVQCTPNLFTYKGLVAIVQSVIVVSFLFLFLIKFRKKLIIKVKNKGVPGGNGVKEATVHPRT